LLSAISLLFAVSLGAQSAEWSKLKSIASGAEIRFELSGKRPVKGGMQAVTANAAMWNTVSANRHPGRKEVLRLSRKKTSCRMRNALIGLAGRRRSRAQLKCVPEN
jgi:hypothetical protein